MSKKVKVESVILLLIFFGCLASAFVSFAKADDTNRALPFDISNWNFGSYTNYYNDYSVYHSGSMSIRSEANPTARELNGPFMSVESGDNIVFKCWIKTEYAAETEGARIGIDLHGLNADDEVTLYSWLPSYSAGSWVAWNSDWTLQTINATIPDDIYGEINPWTGTPYTVHSNLIYGMVAWMGVHPLDCPADAWFADAELYINPESETPPAPPTGEEEIITSNEVASTGYTTILEGSGFHKQAAQTFTVGSTYNYSLTKIAINITHWGTIQPITVQLKATSGGSPTGSVLSSGNISTFTDRAWTYCEMTPYTLVNSTKYALIVTYPTGDGSNFIAWYMNEDNPYADGSYFLSTDSGSSWSADTDIDFLFRVYGEPVIETVEDTYVLIADVITPDNTTYTTGTVPFSIVPIGNDTVSSYQINAYLSGNPVGSNFTTASGSFTGLANGTYTFACYITGEQGTSNYQTVVFTVAIPPEAEPTPTPVYLNDINSDWLWQYLYNYDFVGFVIACWVADLGESFYVIVSMIITLALYIRLKNLPVMIAMWFLLGGLWIVLLPMASPVILLLMIFGIASLLIYIFMLSKN